MTIQALTGIEIPLEQGLWKYNAVIVTGPILLQVSTDNGSTFRTMTAGSLAATEDKVINWGGGEIFKATIPGGDTLSLSLVEKGAF